MMELALRKSAALAISLPAVFNYLEITSDQCFYYDVQPDRVAPPAYGPLPAPVLGSGVPVLLSGVDGVGSGGGSGDLSGCLVPTSIFSTTDP